MAMAAHLYERAVPNCDITWVTRDIARITRDIAWVTHDITSRIPFLHSSAPSCVRRSALL